ncbi:helix-turn-helix transcriptional regulator [Neobacillus sp. MM2021_6]|uniref:helix-turn-helix domain-containing protein n=1 Tax=Bacillaceae TaxID=186817 RepID=UPI00140D0912|nr:helix-turn-helix transcriptional regulator [Neobacillus sp. MM2021_6]NHC20991.1 helix-turn-helix transcriptional regulator [Bacillus sp. MM2020_4]
MLGKRLKYLREQMKKENSKFTQGYLANKIGVARSTYTAYENGTKQPPLETVNKLADIFDVTTDYLQGRSESKQQIPSQTSKDDKDIAKRMEQIKNDLAKQDGLSFNGEPMSEEAIESLMEAMEHVVRQTQRINKKYIPKKYRKDEDTK